MDYAGGVDPDLHYLDGFRGAYNALMDARIPFDLVSDKRLDPAALARYRSILLPNLACLDEATASQLERYVEAGGHVVATWRTGFCDEWGVERAEPWIARVLDARYRGRTQHNLKAAYAWIGEPAHPVLSGAGDTDLLPLAGGVCEFDAGTAEGAGILRLIPPVEARAGSGMSVPEFNAAGSVTDIPLLLTARRGAGSVCYFPWEPDRIGFHFGLRDPMRLLAQAVRTSFAPDAGELITVRGVGLVDTSVMDAPGSRVLTLVNFNGASGMRSGHRRAVEEVVPLHGLAIDLRLPAGTRCVAVEQVVAGGALDFEQANGRIRLRLPVLEEFESLLVRVTSA
jgi:hypothetical protein